jgi:biotin synthase
MYLLKVHGFFFDINNMIKELKNKIIKGIPISQPEVIELSKTTNKDELYNSAEQIRKHFCGDNMDLCSITNAKSGNCSENCKWCSQSAHNQSEVEIYDLINKEEAVNEAVYNAEKGVHKHSLVCSGKSANNKLIDQLIPIYKEIKEKANISLCASMGLLNKAQLLKLKKEAKIDHYHCNLETAPSFFHTLCSTHSIEDKIETIKHAQELGIEVCSGGIIGMGETMEQRIELAFALKNLNIKSIPINILNPIKGTPLENCHALTEEEILTTIALFRFINPDAKIRFAGGRLQIKKFQDKALKAGINATLTGDYLTTIGSNIDDDIRDFTKAGYKLFNTKHN